MDIKFPGNSNEFITGVTQTGFERFLPEPVSGIGRAFQSLIGAGLQVGKAITGANLVGIEPEYAALIQEQLHAQEQMQRVSLVSNIEKSKHETEMSVVRNVRIG